MGLSKIGWLGGGYTFNIAWGCTKISPACDNCYAESLAKRAGFDVWGADKPRRLFGDKHWAEPLKWNDRVEMGGPKLVFCASMADWAENHPDYDALRERLFALIRATPNLIWLLLTKRIGNVRKMLPPDWGDGYPNVCIMATIANQPEAERDMEKLLATPAAYRGISVEPVLSEIFLRRILVRACSVGTPVIGDAKFYLDALQGTYSMEATWRGGFARTSEALKALDGPECKLPPRLPGLDWVITGGESGPKSKARGPHPYWYVHMLEDCAATHTAYFFKQHGTWGPVPRDETLPGRPRMIRFGDIVVTQDGRRAPVNPDGSLPAEFEGEGTPLRAASQGVPHLPELYGRRYMAWPEAWEIHHAA